MEPRLQGSSYISAHNSGHMLSLWRTLGSGTSVGGNDISGYSVAESSPGSRMTVLCCKIKITLCIHPTPLPRWSLHRVVL